MRVLLVAFYFGRDESIGGERARAMVRYLPDEGIEVVPLFLAPPGGATVQGVGVEGISHFYTPRWRYLPIRCLQSVSQRLGVYQPILGDWRDRAIRRGLAVLGELKFDAILASYPPIEAFEVGLALSEQAGLPLFADFRDGLLFEPLEQQRLAVSSVRRYYEQIEKCIMGRARLVTTVSDPLTVNFRHRYPGVSVQTIPNGFDPAEKRGGSTDRNYFIGPNFHLLHTGRLSASRQGGSLECLLQALDDLSNEKVCLHLVGQLTSQELAKCKPWVKRGLVVIWGAVPRPQALAMQQQADALLVLVPPEQKSVATGKIFEYLMARKPILALAAGSEAGSIVEKTQSGIVASMRDVPGVKAGLELLLARPLAEWLVLRNETVIAEYSRKTQMQAFAALLRRYTQKEESVL